MVGEVEQLQELGAAVIQARANFLHHTRDMIAVRGGVILQPFHLPFQIIFLIHRTDTCIQSNTSGTLWGDHER
jgi:hypothetical protein